MNLYYYHRLVIMVWTWEAQLSGNRNSIVTHKKQFYDRVKKYNESPNLCEQCQTPLSYEHRNNKFCSHSCAAVSANKSRGFNSRGLKTNVCSFCGNPSGLRAKFCSNKCRTMSKFLSKTNPDIAAIKSYLILLRGHTCEHCRKTRWVGHKIPLECHHKDGDKRNNALNNLELVCPNCHVFTDTYKGKNNKTLYRRNRK